MLQYHLWRDSDSKQKQRTLNVKEPHSHNLQEKSCGNYFIREKKPENGFGEPELFPCQFKPKVSACQQGLEINSTENDFVIAHTILTFHFLEEVKACLEQGEPGGERGFGLTLKNHPDSSLTTKIRSSKNEANTLKCYWGSFENAR